MLFVASSKLLTSQSLIQLSLPPDASMVPSLLNASWYTVSLCPLSSHTWEAVPKSHTKIFLSAPEVGESIMIVLNCGYVSLSIGGENIIIVKGKE